MDVSKQSDTGGFFGWLDKAADYAKKGAEVYQTVKAANATPAQATAQAIAGQMLNPKILWGVGIGVVVIVLVVVLRK